MSSHVMEIVANNTISYIFQDSLMLQKKPKTNELVKQRSYNMLFVTSKLIVFLIGHVFLITSISHKYDIYVKEIKVKVLMQ